MRWVPFNVQTALQLAVATLLPAVPLTLTMFFAAGFARAAAQDCLLNDSTFP
jgi:hypothetical protein